MIVNVAGAGAGKTTKMADIIMNYDIPDGKVVFCIAFTNAAADNIKEKVAGKLGSIPSNIRVSTIHSFLYQELIEPYYYFLYGKQFGNLSVIELPLNNSYKNAKLLELERDNILHISKIPEKAKWVTYQKSRETKATRETRKRIMSLFSSYCAAIFVDEAQDISKDICDILSSLENAGIEITLYGDPKQDVKGFGCFRSIIDNSSDVTYISECYRCPQAHLDLSNTLAGDQEKQVATKDNVVGSIEFAFESDIADIKGFMKASDYGLCYISQKHAQFHTHSVNERDEHFETLRHEVFRAMEEKWKGVLAEIEINRGAYYVTEIMLENYQQSGDAGNQVAKWVEAGAFDRLGKQQYAQMVSAFPVKETETDDAVVVRSIEIVKGLEAERCLFILTPDLAPYLFRTKISDNKTSHLLYVALTRSKKHMTILISRKVESTFPKSFIFDYMKSFNA